MPFLSEADTNTLAEKPVLTDKDSLDFYNPPQAFQESITGVSFLTAYSEASSFLNHMVAKIEGDSGPIDFKGKRIVDFGSGWGRMLRLLRNKPELDETELYGCEQHLQALKVCQRSLPRVCLSRTRAYPPCDLRSGFIDIVYAYSVFSHLNAPPHLAWAQEIYRILKPSGYACVTVQPRDFITICKQYREGTRPIKNEWHQLLSGAFLNDEDCFKRYDAGELVFNFTVGAGLDSDVYGDAAVPKAFFEKHWTRMGYRLVDWYDHTEHFGAQSRVLLQKVR